MKSRLPLIALFLVVVPTAVLSLMAARSVRSREVVLERQIEKSAEEAIQAVADRMEQSFAGDLEMVRAAMSGPVARWRDNAALKAIASRLADSRETVRQVYLFMNPWGFLWPMDAWESWDSSVEVGDADAPQSEDASAAQSLVASLRRSIASSGSLSETIRLTSGGESYFFSSVDRRKVLYAGFEVDPDGFARRLSGCVAAVSGKGFALCAEGPGLRNAPAEGGEDAAILVRDSFARESQPVDTFPVSGKEPVATGRLAPPFDYVRLSAFIVDSAALSRTGVLEARLRAWGVLVLAAGIIGGAWLVMRQAVSEIREARARSEFVAGVSHDLRTPVASVKVLAEGIYLGHVPDPAKQHEFLGRIVRECEHLTQLVERVLFFVRFGQNALAYHSRSIAVRSLIDSVVQTFHARFRGGESADGEAGEGGVMVVVDVAEGLPDIMADEGAVTQVILNLLDNAVKYSRGEDKGKILVSARGVSRARHRFGPRREWIRISVRDNGLGIDSQEQRKIFRRFYRTKAASVDIAAGVGLGLALCKHVVVSHGGWIEVQSTLGQGSTFSFFLPSAKE